MSQTKAPTKAQKTANAAETSQTTAAEQPTSIQVNGRPVAFAGGALTDLLAQMGLDQRSGMAVAVNDQVVPKSQWSGRTLDAGDRITLITAAAGG